VKIQRLQGGKKEEVEGDQGKKEGITRIMYRADVFDYPRSGGEYTARTAVVVGEGGGREAKRGRVGGRT